MAGKSGSLTAAIILQGASVGLGRRHASARLERDPREAQRRKRLRGLGVRLLLPQGWYLPLAVWQLSAAAIIPFLSLQSDRLASTCANDEDRLQSDSWTQEKPTDHVLSSMSKGIKGPPILPPHLLNVSFGSLLSSGFGAWQSPS